MMSSVFNKPFKTVNLTASNKENQSVQNFQYFRGRNKFTDILDKIGEELEVTKTQVG